jgi:hypothetical protein
MRKVSTVLLALLLAFVPVLKAADLPPVELPNLGESRMVLPWSDFKDLLEKLLQKAPPPIEEEGIPAFTLSEASFTGSLQGVSARMEGTLVLHILKERGWVKVPIFRELVPLAEVLMDGKPVALSVEDGVQQLVLKAAPGVHTLKIAFYAQVDNSDGPSAIDFTVPETPVATLKFTVPAKRLAFEIQPSGFVDVRRTPTESTAFAVLPPGERVTLSWGEEIAQEKGTVAMKEANIATLVSVSEDAIKATSTLSYRIRGGTARSFEFTLPKNVVVTSVTGVGSLPFVKEDADGQTMYRVGLNFDAKGSYQLSVSYERTRKEASGTEA